MSVPLVCVCVCVCVRCTLRIETMFKHSRLESVDLNSLLNCVVCVHMSVPSLSVCQVHLTD